MSHLASIMGVYGGAGSVPPDLSVDFALEPPPEGALSAIYEVRIVKPLLSSGPGGGIEGGQNEYRFVRDGWPYASILLNPGDGDSAQVQWAINEVGQIKVEIDRWRFKQVWDEADFNPGGAPIRNLVPESTTMWLYRNGIPLWAGFLRDIDGDPTGAPNIVLTGEEFTGSFNDVTITENWVIEEETVAAVLERVMASELRAAWMLPHYHDNGYGTDTLFSAEVTQLETRHISEIIDQLAVAAGFEWQQWIGPSPSTMNPGPAHETHFSVHPIKAGFDYQTLGLHIEWGEGTAQTAFTMRYTYSTRGTRTRATVIGFDDAIAIHDYNHPLGVPRRDNVMHDETLPPELVPQASIDLVRYQGLPQLSVRTALRIGDFEGGWPFLWLWADDPTTGGCSPVGSRFNVRIVDAGMVYDALLRTTTWGLSITAGGEFMVLDLVQEEAHAAGLDLEIQVIPTPSQVALKAEPGEDGLVPEDA